MSTLLLLCAISPRPPTPLPGNGWGTTISGPAQPLVGSVAGPSPKRPNVNEQPLVGPFSQRLAEEWISGV